jgi:photosystem II stability/assembly factor-like uncharacterized protein
MRIKVVLLILFAVLSQSCAVATDEESPTTNAPETLTLPPKWTATNTPPPSATNTPKPTATKTSTSSSTPLVPTMTPLPALHPDLRFKGGQLVTISYIRMITPLSGWAIASDPNTSQYHILATADGGSTWRDVTPQHPLVEGDDLVETMDVFFLDATKAWIAHVTYTWSEFGVDPKQLVVMSTFDGGRTWFPSHLVDHSVLEYSSALGLSLQFVDVHNGWILFSLGNGMHKNHAALFRTTDGGISWDLIIRPRSHESGNLDYSARNGWVFGDVQTGLVTFGRGPMGLVIVNWTHDGGLFWDTYVLPQPNVEADKIEFDGATCRSYSPVLLSSQYGFLALECRVKDGDLDDVMYFLYATEDGGQTWRSNLYPGGQLVFTSPEVGWSLGRSIYQTRDGGHTWRYVKGVYWDGQFSFVDERNGWAVARNEDEIALVKTTDGGRTWVKIEPIIDETEQ